MNFVIEKGIPVARARASRGNCAYPFDKMEVNDSFLTDNRSVSSSASAWTKKLLEEKQIVKKFATRKVKEGAWRVWRVE